MGTGKKQAQNLTFPFFMADSGFDEFPAISSG